EGLRRGRLRRRHDLGDERGARRAARAGHRALRHAGEPAARVARYFKGGSLSFVRSCASAYSETRSVTWQPSESRKYSSTSPVSACSSVLPMSTSSSSGKG